MSKNNNVASYSSSREDTWRALVYVFKSYPIKTIDLDGGYIETEILKGSRYWKAPHEKNMNINGLSAVIKVYLFYDKPFSKVEIQKTIFQQKSFISNPTVIASDLLEETNILYRIKREIYIRKGFKELSK